jgi:hypothetical protein
MGQERLEALLRDMLGPIIREEVAVVVDEKLRLHLGDRRAPKLAVAKAEPAPESVSRQEAAIITGYSVRTIGRLIDSGKLRAFGTRRDRITRFELDRMMAETPNVGDGEDDVAGEVERLLARKK